MTFEEEFPSMKDSMDVNMCGYDVVFVSDVEKHLLDKQRVRELLNRLSQDNPPQEAISTISLVRSGLGL